MELFKYFIRNSHSFGDWQVVYITWLKGQIIYFKKKITYQNCGRCAMSAHEQSWCWRTTTWAGNPVSILCKFYLSSPLARWKKSELSVMKNALRVLWFYWLRLVLGSVKINGRFEILLRPSMVHTILKRSWILIVVFQSPWIRLRSSKSTLYFFITSWQILEIQVPCLKTFLCMRNILLLFLYLLFLYLRYNCRSYPVIFQSVFAENGRK